MLRDFQGLGLLILCLKLSNNLNLTVIKKKLTTKYVKMIKNNLKKKSFKQTEI